LPWWNDRVFYEVFVRSFFDSDGNSVGDLQGLISKLDYLNDSDPNTDTDLGITGIWLMPVNESPSYHGYDVVDYFQINKSYGTNEDFRQFLAEAHKRDIVVIIDLVLNHTSQHHPWFLDSRTPGSEHDTWYIWEEEKPDYLGPWNQLVWHKFGDRYYYGVFWGGMPDLNYHNGEVTKAMYDVIRFWLEDMGVDGFRLDAIKHLIEDGPVQENTAETHAWLAAFDNYVHTLAPDALTVGEVWNPTDDVAVYVNNDELDLAFEFNLAEAIIESIQNGNSRRLETVQAAILQAYPQGQYAVFLTNHDQNRVMSQLIGKTDSAKVASTLLLTNPGVPFIYYGEEIGMQGENPHERIRTPMQWDDTPGTAGFTSGTPWEELAEAYETFNVDAETGDPDSLLNHYRGLIRLRNDHPALRTGTMWLVQSDAPAVYSYLRHSPEETLLVLVNLSKEPVEDYRLTLEKGPLRETSGAVLLSGKGQPTAPTLNARGGFDSYVPLPSLAPRSSLILQLSP
jgi:glycosidase